MERSAVQNPPAKGFHTSLSQNAVIQKFSVSIEYPVVFTRGIFSTDNAVLPEVISRGEPPRRKRVAVVIDKGVLDASPLLTDRIHAYFEAFRSDLQLAGALETVPGGESIKNTPGMAERIYRRFLDRSLDRHSYVLTIGGGSALDLVGFAAATFHRGLRHIRVPTTVLAQNDAGIGVKNGRNSFGVKNLVGSFHPPWGVIVDGSFLETLPDREKRAGLAEAVKVALIRDRAFFLWIEENAASLARFESGALDRLIRHCAMLHLRQIATGGDPFETGSARPLDFGHWAAHKLESLSGHDLRHGEAVAIGIALDARYSVLAGLLPPPAGLRISRLLQRLGFSLWHPALEMRSGDGNLLLLDGLREFREHLGGELSVTLLEALGKGVEVDTIDTGRVREAIEWLRPNETGTQVT